MKKVLVFIPDGVGLRNFVFGDFYKLGITKGFAIKYWNHTNFPIDYPTLNVKKGKSHRFTDILKTARKHVELKQFANKFNSKVYLSYLFPLSYKTTKSSIKSILIKLFSVLFNTEIGLIKLRELIINLERKSAYYQKVYKQLQQEKPNILILSNQRAVNAIAPVIAAQDLGIKTATFIFSWDNLPKATMVVEPDYYFVWSNYMKDELLKYYPYISNNQVYITGSPQFEIHFKPENLIPKTTFYNKYKLTEGVTYICFSGDDVTTSPNDEFYLADVADAIEKLNEAGCNYGLIYRKCPVDFSNRHKSIVEKYKEIIKVIDPAWESKGNNWNEVMPTKEDNKLLASTIHYSQMVINVGSSMVFDYVSQNKPCAFINYNTQKSNDLNWDIRNIYKYVHFKSMPSNTAVYWINSKSNIKNVILEALAEQNITETKRWFQIVNENSYDASHKIWEAIAQIK